MATGDTLIGWDAAAYWPPASNFARPSVSSAEMPCLLFDDTTDETAYFTGEMPGQYDGTTALNVVIKWKLETAGSSTTMEWEAAFCRVDDDAQSVDSLTFAAAQAVVATEAGTSGELDYATVALTNAQADGVQGGDLFVLRVVRDASEGTATGNAQLYSVSIELQ